jgi:YVTN family beta-propeller protein
MSLFITLLLVMAGISYSSLGAPISSSGRVLVANKGEHTLGIIDPSTNQQVATIPESGVTGHEVIASPDGNLAFVPIYGDSGVGKPGSDGRTIDVIDVRQGRLIHTIDLGRGVRPHCPIVGPKDGLLYVTTELDNTVTIIDPHSLKIVGSVPTSQPESHMLTITSDGRYGYTANVGPGTISVLDLAERKTLGVIPVASHIQRVSVSADDRWVFTSDTEKPRLAVIDSRTRKVERWIPLPGAGYGSAPTPDRKYVLVAIPGAKSVAIIDLANFQVTKTISVPEEPQEVVIRPDGQVAYVSCDRTGQVAAIGLHDWSVKLIKAGNGADGLAWMN